MADDARISTAFPRHPKTVKLQRRLGAAGCWSLVCLFLWVADNRPDGDLSGMSDEDLEIAAGWSGDQNSFVATLCEVGFLDGRDSERSIHDWVEHNPWAAKRGERVAKAKKAAAARWETAAQNMLDACSPHATGMHSACSDTKRAMPSTQPNPTQPNHTKKPPGADAPAEWIQAEAWAGFVDMRRKTREPLTDRAVTLIVKELDKLRTAGHDVGAVLDQSTRNNWKDVYPLKGHNPNGNGNRAERRQAENITAAEEAVSILERRMAH
jgi:hypothetical protein